MTSHPARDMRGVVQSSQRQRDFAMGVDMTVCPHENMSGCANLTAVHGDFCVINSIARTVLRDNADGIDAVMTMRRESRFSLRIRRDPSQACHGKRGREVP